MAKIILSAFSDEYAVPFEKQLLAMRELGVENIELRTVDGKNVSALTEAEVLEAKHKLEHYGISVSAIGSPIGKIKLDGDMNAHMELARRIFDTANKLGTSFVRIFSFYAPEGDDITRLRDRVLEALDRLCVLSKDYGVTLCHENEAKIYGDVPERCRDIVDSFNGKIKTVFDMGNYVLESVDPYEAYRLLSDSIAYFHIKDALYEGAIVPPGVGKARIRDILEAHKGCASEDFFATLEPHLQLFSGLNSLVGRAFENPYKYSDTESAFRDALYRFKELAL